MKAYYVYERAEETNNDIVHAEKPSQAKLKSRMARYIFGVDNPIIDLYVRRIPALDDKLLTTPNILAVGFSTYCDYLNCEHEIYGDQDTFIRGDEAFCEDHNPARVAVEIVRPASGKSNENW